MNNMSNELKSTLALAFGIVSAVAAFIGYFTSGLGVTGIIFGIVGIGFGVASIIFSKLTGEDITGGKKIAGRILGIAGTSLSVLALIIGWVCFCFCASACAALYNM